MRFHWIVSSSFHIYRLSMTPFTSRTTFCLNTQAWNYFSHKTASHFTYSPTLAVCCIHSFRICVYDKHLYEEHNLLKITFFCGKITIFNIYCQQIFIIWNYYQYQHTKKSIQWLWYTFPNTLTMLICYSTFFDILASYRKMRLLQDQVWEWTLFYG